jgi:hypothetical protein
MMRDHVIFHKNPSRMKWSRHLTTIAYTICSALRILLAHDNAHKHSPQIAHPSLAKPAPFSDF